ncbi:Mitochondrial-processing peptidase subunit alpha [Dispira simplex]|nr:Mitochondrial-processing peptidase subunit alpha [Dispira simplex]
MLPWKSTQTVLRSGRWPSLSAYRRWSPSHLSQRFYRPTSCMQHAISIDDIRKVSQSAGQDPGGIQLTTLPNGVRVATQNSPGYFCGFGIYIDTGSRYETPNTRGCSHILDRMAFKSTTNLDAEAVNEAIESMGGNIQRASSRENIMYQASVFQQDLPRVASMFAEVVCRPRLTQEELEEQKQIVQWELAEIQAKYEQYLPEILHETAYGHNTLGNPLMSSEETLATMTPDKIRDFLKTWFTADRLVVATIGAPHEQVCSLVQEHYGDMKAAPGFTKHTAVPLIHGLPSPNVFTPGTGTNTTQASPTLDHSSLLGNFSNTASKIFHRMGSSSTTPLSEDPAELTKLPARYTGGTHFAPTPGSPQTHIHLGFAAPGMNSTAIYTLAVLQILLGGGNSFSAGGPGKGMYSRLYTQVLNRYMFVEGCMAFTYSYRDSSLFGISATTDSSAVLPMFEIMVQQLVALLPRYNPRKPYDHFPHPQLAQNSNVQQQYRSTTEGLTDVEVSRAKNQLKSSLMMNLESRPIQLEDLGRQIQGFNFALTPQEMCANIDQVTKEDIYGLVQHVLASTPTVVAAGEVRELKRRLASILRTYGLTAPN